MQIPAYYVLDSKLYPGDLKYQVILGKYLQPEYPGYKIITHEIGDQNEDSLNPVDLDEFCNSELY